MRRKQGVLVPLERAILSFASGFSQRGKSEFYAYQLKYHLAGHIANGIYGEYRGTATGTLYRALARLVAMGYLKDHWEPSPRNRPPRHYYALTTAQKGYYGK